MAIAASVLAGAVNTTNLSSYATASITPTANRLVLAFISSGHATGGQVNTTPTLTGNGLTWVEIGNIQSGNATTGAKTTVFRAMGASPSAEAVTIDFGGITQTRCGWSIVEFSDIDTSGTDGSGAVVQFKTAAATSGTAGTADFDAAFGDGTNNATYSAITNRIAEAVTEEGGFTELHDLAFGADAAHMQSMWRIGEDQTPAPTWTTSAHWAQLVVEIKAAGGGTPATVTPAVIAVTASLPAPAVLAASTVTPAAIATVATLPTPTLLAAARVTPAVIATITVLPTPSILAAALVAPATIAAITALPTPTIIVDGGPAVVTPATISVLAALPTPSILAAVVVTPAGIAISITLPTPVASAGALVLPATIGLVVALPTPTLLAASTVNPATIALLVGLPTPLILVPATVTPATIGLIVGLPTPLIIVAVPTFWQPAPVAYTLNPAGYDPITAGDDPPW